MRPFDHIGYRLKALRKDLSQRDFSQRVKVPFRTYQRYELGERMPKGDVLNRIAVACNVTVDWILTGETNTDYLSDTSKKGIGLRIKELRGHYSLPMFAALLKISLPSLQRYECGDRIPPDSVLKHLASVTGYPVEWILTGSEEAWASRELDQPYLFSNEAYEILDLMQGLDETRLKDVLRYIRDQKLLSEQEKKRKTKRK